MSGVVSPLAANPDATGREPAEVVALVVEAVRGGRFYILTSANRTQAILRRADDILAGNPPAQPFT
jgi:hypothetical protein